MDRDSDVNMPCSNIENEPSVDEPVDPVVIQSDPDHWKNAEINEYRIHSHSIKAFV